MFDDQESVVIHVLQGERPEIHRNRSIGKFRLSLESGGGERSKVVVRFDLTLDGTLKVTATQPATGRARELTIDNALSQFRADERDRAEARLGAMFDASEELIDDEDLPSPKQWRTNDSDSGTLSTDGFQSAQSEFQEAVALLKQAETLRPSVEGQDAMDLESLCKNLEDAMAADDPVAVAGLSAELDDLLFYVR
jgi:molecular chaperone DnaK